MKEYACKKLYLLYTRKSTDDSDNQKNSIAYQKAEGLHFAMREHLPLATLDIEGFCTSGVISERHTGFKEDNNFSIGKNGMVQYRIERPKFHRLVELLYMGEFKGVIFLCWDRASRNKNDDNILRKLMKRGVDIRFVQANYDKSSSGELHMDVDGMFAQHYSRVISEKVTNTIRKLKDEGIFTSRAPIGYLNTGDSRNKPFDPVRATLVKQLFEKYADGSWTLAELAIWANNQGLTMPLSRRHRTKAESLLEEEIIYEAVSRPLTFTNLQKILINPFYIGKIHNSQKQYIYSNSHKPLIEEPLFYKVQEVLKRKKVSVHYIEKANLPYRGMVRCGFCGRVYTPYLKKDIYYYGARCVQNCENMKRSINATFIQTLVGKKIISLSFTETQITELEKHRETDPSAFESRRISVIEEHERNQRKIREDMAYLRENKLSLLKTGTYSMEEFLQEESKLNIALEEISLKIQTSEVSIPDVLKDTIILSELLKRAYKYYCVANPLEKQAIIQKTFSELNVSENILSFQCKNGFRFLECAPVSFGAPTEWISEVVSNHKLIQSSIEDLKELLNHQADDG